MNKSSTHFSLRTNKAAVQRIETAGSRNDPLILARVGSHAYGLNTAQSDEDWLGIYAAPTVDFLGLNPPRDGDSTRVFKEPDETWHEVGKFCRLALKCNPTITELLWMDGYSLLGRDGLQLVRIRDSFLSSRCVRSSYLGYASEQFHRIQRRESNDFSSDTKNRTAKHGRHLKRLLAQGLELWTTGKLTLQVDNPEEYFEFGERVQAGDMQVAEDLLSAYEYQFNHLSSVLPPTPDAGNINRVLLDIRRERID